MLTFMREKWHICNKAKFHSNRWMRSAGTRGRVGFDYRSASPTTWSAFSVQKFSNHETGECSCQQIFPGIHPVLSTPIPSEALKHRWGLKHSHLRYTQQASRKHSGHLLSIFVTASENSGQESRRIRGLQNMLCKDKVEPADWIYWI